MMKIDTAQHTLVHVLQHNATHSNHGVTFIEGSQQEFTLSYKALYQEALHILHNLNAAGVQQGHELVIQIEDNRWYLSTFWACLLGGIVAVPVALGSQDEHKLKLLNIWQTLHHPWWVTEPVNHGRLEKYCANNQQQALFEQLNARYLPLESIQKTVQAATPIAPKTTDLAYIQFSSGSTGMPKGVQLTHANLIINTTDIVECGATTEKDSAFGWMPLTHDMGLICFYLTGVVANINLYIMPTGVFIRRPVLWIEKTHEHRITQLYSPNFGFQYCLSALNNSNRNPNWDLSCVRYILNGAEPIYKEVCDTFLKEMGPYGLKNNVMFPGYGLAEASVVMCLSKVETPYRYWYVNRNKLNVGNAIEVLDNPEEEAAITFIEEGHPARHAEIRVCNMQDEPLPERTIGELQIKGGNVTAGYYNNPEATQKLFTADGWARTGDLGFMDQGRVTFTGRIKNLIIINGQNYYPQDIERVAQKVPNVELGKVAACGIGSPEQQHDELVIFVTHKDHPESFFALANAVRQQVANDLGIMADRVLAVRRIPKTTSGKIQYFYLEEQYRSGQFNEQIKALVALGTQAPLKAELATMEPKKGLKHLEKWLTQEALQLLAQKQVQQLDAQIPLNEQGFDSNLAVNFRNRIEQATGLAAGASLIYEFPTIQKLTQHISQQLQPNTQQATTTNGTTRQQESPDLLSQIEGLSDDEIAKLLE